MNIYASLIVLITVLSLEVDGKCEVREPPDLTTSPEKDDAGFYLTVSGNPKTYTPGELYTVSLQGDKTQFIEKKFVEFLLVVESNEDESRDNRRTSTYEKSGRAGSFQLLGDVLTRFSDHCTNTVTQTSAVVKSEIQVLWMAPPSGSGCVDFKGTVVEETGLWAMDKGRLSLTLCEIKVAEHSEPDDVVEPCCACEEAKYEVAFEGLWSEKTHPKDFPSSRWLLHFSDIIGASHSADYRFWEYGGYASKGLEQVAKWGSPRILESELKAESEHIRTIIKARGLWYPNHAGKTFAVFRTDKKNHLVSLVSMLGPSPDWIVGVSGLELCRKNCSWAESKELYLYPWDAGVDSGISYESPDSPTEPKVPITRISSHSPNDPRQPFFDEAGKPMRPLAKLIVTRQRLYKKSCSDEDYLPEDEVLEPDSQPEIDFEEDEEIPGCQVSEWSDWSSCSVTCGKGISMRTRDFLIPGKAAMMGCDRTLVQKEMCSSSVSKCEGSNGFYANAPGDFLPDDMCATSEWTKWSECSTTCGKGFRSRTRRFFNRMGRKKCPHIETMEKLMCAGSESDCSIQSRGKDPKCAVTTWSDWSPCSVSCGKGLKVRTRLYLSTSAQQSTDDCSVRLMEKGECEGTRPECKFDPEDAKFICGLSKETGPCRGYFPRWYFDSKAQKCTQFIYGGCRGNSNNFARFEECDKICKSNFNSTSFMIAKNKQMMLEKQNIELMKKQHMLMKQEIMSGKTMSESKELQPHNKNIQNDDSAVETQEINCLVTSWSPWSECSATCGKGFRKKFRTVKVHPSRNGKKCPKKLDRKQKCVLSPCQKSCTRTPWSAWSECSGWCGQDGTKERYRSPLNDEDATVCPQLKEEKFCTSLSC